MTYGIICVTCVQSKTRTDVLSHAFTGIIFLPALTKSVGGRYPGSKQRQFVNGQMLRWQCTRLLTRGFQKLICLLRGVFLRSTSK